MRALVGAQQRLAAARAISTAQNNIHDVGSDVLRLIGEKLLKLSLRAPHSVVWCSNRWAQLGEEREAAEVRARRLLEKIAARRSAVLGQRRRLEARAQAINQASDGQ